MTAPLLCMPMMCTKLRDLRLNCSALMSVIWFVLLLHNVVRNVCLFDRQLVLTNDWELTRFYDKHSLMLNVYYILIVVYFPPTRQRVLLSTISGCDIRCRSTFWPYPGRDRMSGISLVRTTPQYGNRTFREICTWRRLNDAEHCQQPLCDAGDDSCCKLNLSARR